jgi:hypothetical protein
MYIKIIVINKFIKNKQFEELNEYFKKNFNRFNQSHNLNYNKILLGISCLRFFDLIKQKNFDKAYEVFQSLSGDIWEKNFYQISSNTSNNNSMMIDDNFQHNEILSIDLYDENSNIKAYSLFNISSLLCFDDLNDSEYSFMLNSKQKDLISEQINSCILELVGLNKESVLEILIKQNELARACAESIKNCGGEKIKIK